jgi:DNA-binding NtrC family response regulator
MTGSRLALVAEDQRLANNIQTHLRKALGEAIFLCGIDDVRNHLGRETDGLLLLATGATKDCEPILRLVQEIYLQNLPPIIMIVEGEKSSESDLSNLDPYIARRLAWPADASQLVNLIRERMGRVRAFLGTQEETVEQIVSRRLLRQTPTLFPLVDRIGIAASHDVTVLLTGETGTGKTHLARLMHECSPRKKEPFLTVPCGAQPANLIESAFFGHVRGAFTGADRAKVGKFEAAGHGTILLDEIDTLGLEQQAGLLRVIESGEYEPVGSNETKLCHARIIVASNWDLDEAVRSGKFREDLFYRLNVMSFHLPPLRERPKDIEPLVRGMAARFNTKFRKDLFNISRRALDALEAFPWPGNIRQLENFIQQAVLVSNGDELLWEHLPQQVRDYRPSARECVASSPPEKLDQHVAQLERSMIQQTLAKHGYSRARAASDLGISRVTLYKKMKKYNLMRAPLRPGSA